MAKSTIEEVLAAKAAYRLAVESFLGFTPKGFTEGSEPLLTSSDEVLTDLLVKASTQKDIYTQIEGKLTPEEQKAFEELKRKAGIESAAATPAPVEPVEPVLP